MTASPPTPRPGPSLWGAGILAALILGGAVLLFVAIYLVLPGEHGYFALLTIGILALVFALFSYLAEALSRQPSAQRAVAWGFYGMGFAVLFLTIGLGPTYGTLSGVGEIVSLLVTLLALIVSVVFIVWRRRSVAATEARLRRRAMWDASLPPSALDYPAANAPSVPKVGSQTPVDATPPRSP